MKFGTLQKNTLAVLVVLLLGLNLFIGGAFLVAKTDKNADAQKLQSTSQPVASTLGAHTSTPQSNPSKTTTQNTATTGTSTTYKPYVPPPYTPNTTPAYTPPPTPIVLTCDQAKKTSIDSAHNQKLAAEEASHNLTQNSINAMPAQTALQIVNKLNAQATEDSRHSSALAGIANAYQAALASINC
jgi:hypothetical protein